MPINPDMFSIQLWRAWQHVPPEVGKWSEDGTTLCFYHNAPAFASAFETWSQQLRPHKMPMKWVTFTTYLHNVGFELVRDPACRHVQCKDPQHAYCRTHPNFTRGMSEEEVAERLFINPASKKPYLHTAPVTIGVAQAESDETVVLKERVTKLEAANQAKRRRITALEEQVGVITQLLHTMADEKLSVLQQELTSTKTWRGDLLTLMSKRGRCEQDEPVVQTTIDHFFNKS